MIDKDYQEGVEVDALEPFMRPFILITHESIFQSNDGRHQAWIHKGHHFIRPTGRGKGIMVSDFLLPWSQLSTQSLAAPRPTGQAYPLMFTIIEILHGQTHSSCHSNNVGKGYWSADRKCGGSHALLEGSLLHALHFEFGG